MRRNGEGGRKDDRHHDEEFFDVKKPKFVDDFGWLPKMKFNDERERHPQGPPGDHMERQGGRGEYHVDKRVLQERRVSKLMTRAAFVSFLMWLFIAIAAVIGLRAAK